MRVLAIMMFAAVPAFADVKSKPVEYDAEGTKCKGVLYYPDDAKGPLPAVIVFHDFRGLNDYAKKRAEMLAKEGYIGFCADVYGDGKTSEHPADAIEFMKAVRQNEKVWLGRAQAALKAIQAQPNVQKDKIATIGYCFGGTTSLMLAFSGADVKSTAVFHAGLPKVTPEQAKSVKGPILICQGAADAMLKEADVKAFRDVLDGAKAKYEYIEYPGATHSFTVEGVEKAMPEFKMKYDADADKKSWDSMMKLFKETLK